MIFIPDYRYHCDFCNVDETINRKMSEYKSEENCLVCGKPMKRKVEDMVCDYLNAKGFYGKKSN